MFKDTKKELERLQHHLLAEEEAEEAEDFSEEQEFAYEVDSYNTDHADMDLDELSNELLRPQSRSWTGVAWFMVLLTLTIVAFLAYVILRNMGVL